MPPSNTRPKRARREVAPAADIPDSSPSRPAKRRRRVAEAPRPTPAPEPEPLPRDREGIRMEDEELIASIIPYLRMPNHEVQASTDHANVVYEKLNKDGVQAYAKLAGRDWTYYVKNLRNVIGRPPEVTQSSKNNTPELNGAPSENVDEDVVHIDLGPVKMVSRIHAEITFDTEDEERWEIVVHGRNGIRINGAPLRKGEFHALVSGEVIEVAGVEMMFVLPQEGRNLQVKKEYLARAGLIDPSAANDSEEHGGNTTSSAPSSSAQTVRGQNGAGPLPIAPAPPDYRRPGTPVSARSNVKYTAGKSPYAGGTMMMNADDVDLALESNHHIKPSYSYAQMITQAILDTEEEKLNLAGIYAYIQDKYAYYRFQVAGGWQNSIRHNLSLNKSFHKVARETDEPGKGMKWCIKAECRDDMAKTCWKGGRGGHRGSSAPSSPANLSYRAKDSAKKRSPKRSPTSRSPTSRSFPDNAPQFTPDRSGQSMHDLPGDGSPLPRHRKINHSQFGLSDNSPASPPVLTSSYMQEEGPALVTPAPARVHPRLAPPSTAQRPSQHMPTSSPAPFWKYAEFGNTPMKGVGLDSSPIKGGAAPLPPSSSPAPSRSPFRNGSPAKQTSAPESEEVEEEDEGFDLTKGFQSIGSFHAPVSNGLPVAPATPAINSS
ncbi:Fork-head transcriptional regulator [Lachnellula hyalina]|uniref:Fork-head transcriptional regulator n=1 Tax=Lachnellula hyalina TaxID=1316788 RepID=A0A8H8QVV2_9HELO|nr:Fork-head transcriptional regulator [Lachnellula hyalina]TVY23643.1 Fork-head transcriptional regulator [Lachnellula hyalina]